MKFNYTLIFSLTELMYLADNRWPIIESLFFVQTIMRGEFIVHHFLFRKINDTANTPHKKCFMSRKHFRDPDGFNRNQVKVPSRLAPAALVLLLALQHHQMNEDWHWFLFKNWYIWLWKFIRVVSQIWRKKTKLVLTF